MHHLILPPSTGKIIDHIDGNPLNNRRSNLREATHQENARNYRKPETGRSSKYKGVCKRLRDIKWTATIRNGKNKHLGVFDTEDEAARAYDQAAKELYGAFAKLNFA